MSELSPVYVASVNTPGYLPQNEPVGFASAREAWAYLASERERDEDAGYDGAADAPGYTETLTELRHLADGGAVHNGRSITGDPHGGDAPGVVYADTPGYAGDHDLGLAYVVTVVLHADYPHHAGYHHGCLACEAMCHCTPDSAECVYGGDHD